MSETTKPEDTGQNHLVIEWLSRVDPDRPFLKTVDRVWTYGESLSEVSQRVSDEVVSLDPHLDADSVFDCLGAIADGGAVLLGPDIEDPRESIPDGTALVVFTSGTGGRPKGVRLTMANLDQHVLCCPTWGCDDGFCGANDAPSDARVRPGAV
jgi:hypothetical protein